MILQPLNFGVVLHSLSAMFGKQPHSPTAYELVSRNLKPLLAIVICWLAFSPVLLAQVSVSGWTPPADKQPGAKKPTLSIQERALRGEAPLSRRHPEWRLDLAQTRRLPALDPRLMRSTETQADPRKRLRVGVIRPLPRPLNDLSETTSYSVTEGSLFMARVISEGALLSRLHFIDVKLPEGARLFVYSRANPDAFAGPYQGSGPTGDGELWTPPLAGDELVIEYFTAHTSAPEQVGASPFRLIEVSHIFRDLSAEKTAQQQDAASACNLDLPEEWKEAAKSSVLLQFPSQGGEILCSGTLLNTSNNSGIPYVLTANHCVSNQIEANSLYVTWFYDAPNSSRQYNYGANLIATGLLSDFTLVKLKDPAPPGARFSGWTTERPALSTPVTAIHHPRGSYKRIAFGSTITHSCPSIIPSELCDGFQWVTWSSGIVEPGSSGSGLFTGGAADPKLVATLTGGNSSCSNQPGPDFYGRFDLTFQAIGYYLTGTGCAYAPEAPEKFIGPNSGENSINLNAASDGSACPWTASSQASWLSITTAQGSGSAAISFVADANPGTSPRTGFLVIAGQFIAVTQAGTGSNCQTLQPVTSGTVYQKELSSSDCRSALVAGAYADRYRLDGQAGQQIALNISSQDFRPRVTLFAPDGSLIATGEFYANASGGYITLPASGAYVIEATSSDPDNTGFYALTIYRGCECALSSGRKEFDASGGVGEFTISMPPDCTWRVEAKPDWVTINAGNNGAGNGKIIFAVLPLAGSNLQRKGDIRIYLDNYVNTQNRFYYSNIIQSLPCAYTLSLFSGAVGNLGSSSGTLDMRTGDYCAWTAQSDSPWLTFEEPASGSGWGSRYISYKVDVANLSPNPRTATITVGNAQYRVTQPGIGGNCQILPLTLGQTVNGALQAGCAFPARVETASEFKGSYYSFTGTAGQRIAAALSSPTMNLHAHLIGPDGRVTSDRLSGHGLSYTARIPDTGFLTLPATGQYVVAVESSERNELFSQYTLSLTESSADCAPVLSINELSVTAAGGDGRVAVTQSGSSSCAWAASSNASWLNITSGAVGSGNSSVNFSVAPNTGGARMGYLTIAGQHLKIIQPQANPMAAVSAASYVRRLAKDSLVSLFGINLSSSTEVAGSLPLPKTLGGTSLRLTNQYQHYEVPLFFVSPSQINFHLPADFGGDYTLMVRRADGYTAITPITVERYAPALFSAEASGQGTAVAIILRVRADGSRVYENIAERNASGQLIVKPIDLGPDNEQVYLLLFGTGIRSAYYYPPVSVEIGGENAPLLYAGLQPDFVGLDQVNVQLPKSLRGRGEVPVTITVEGVKSNAVTITIAGEK